jgi:hypothetical protein
LTLTGTGTSWVSGTTVFTLPVITGLTKVSQSITSTTAATVVCTTGTGTGTGNITDNTDSATAALTVANATLAVSPTSVASSSSGNTLTLTGTNTLWTSGTPGSPTFTVSGGTITAQTVASATSATLTYTAPATGPVTITDPSDTATASLAITGGTLTAGTASVVSVGNTIATVTVGNATGGSGTYTYQWYRSTSSGFTPGAGNIVAGATSQTLNDTGLTNGTTYYYINQVTG